MRLNFLQHPPRPSVRLHYSKHKKKKKKKKKRNKKPIKQQRNAKFCDFGKLRGIRIKNKPMKTK